MSSRAAGVEDESWPGRLPEVLSCLGVGLVVGSLDRAVVVNEAFCTMTGYSADEAVALVPFVRIFAPEARDAIVERTAAHLVGDAGPPTRFESAILQRDGRRIPVAVSAQVVWCDGQPAVVAAFGDLRDRHRAESELAIRARQQEVVAELGRQALVHRDVASLIKAAVTAASDTLGVDYAEILELRPGHDSLILRAGVGWTHGAVGNVEVAAGTGSPAGLALESDGPVVVSDLARETRCEVPPVLVEHRVVSGAFVVIRGVDRPYGVLGAEARCPRAFSGDDVHFLRAVANVVADAIEQAQVEAALRAAHDRESRLRQRLEAYSRRIVGAQESERRRIARELHDEIGQALTGLKMTLEDHDRLAPGAAAARVSRARELTAELLRRVHHLSLDLRPALLDDLGLEPALVWLVERYAEQTGVDVALVCSGTDARLDPGVETAAYRIVQEALTNVARHAGVMRAAVDCSVVNADLRVQVADEGIGFDIDAVPVGASTGLVGMEERARSTGGRLWVRSASGRGTTVMAELPLAHTEQASP